ncbi:uncharacterized protein Dmoj_GI21741 [Drosophila mojavensis]|uniref:Uncharacterized protein n=2 Tax=Drosophila mojavensis TaxID=7230 RepID=B4L5J9_DROMO|nr:uncharacterized protein Dmoj_GI21741 [Drosophila mojavensis]
MQFTWILLSLSVLAMHSFALPAGSTTKPKVFIDSSDSTEPMLYHFITEHRPTSMGQNYYLKPGQLVGTFSLDSGTLHVKHEDSKRPISSKLNILFVATAKEKDAAT